MSSTLAQTGAQEGLAPVAPKVLSPSPTIHSDYDPSPNRTLTDLNNHGSPDTKNSGLPASSTLGKAEEDNHAKGGDGFHQSDTAIALSSLPAGRKSILLLCFCLAMFIDAAGVSATFLMTAPIAEDLHIAFNDEAWVLGTYSMVFAATLLFAGRLADLYPPHRIYTIGFIGIAVFYLVISFMENSIAFYVLRAFSALLAVLTIPSAINMIVQMYPEPAEQAKKLALFGMAGALANTIALVLAGVFLLASWRWYFRFITILIAPFAVLAWFMMPKTTAVAEDLPGSEKWKRMDLGGVSILVAALILFILSFTQAPIEGWDSAIFIAPFVISLFLGAGFFVYEAYLPHGYSLLPHDIWSFPNIFPLMLQASSIFMWMACAQLRIATYFQVALGNSAILAAVKLLPMGITALVVGVGSQAAPWLITRPRYVQPIASVFCFAGSMLFAFSGGGHGNDYWKFMFTGQVIGTAGGMLVFIGMNTSIIQSFPLEFAGVGGAFSQVLFQVGGVVGIAIQAGLIGTGDGTIQDWTGSKNSYFFTGGYILFTGLVFVVWYRQYKMPQHSGPTVAV